LEKNEKSEEDSGWGKLQFYSGGKKTKKKRHSLIGSSVSWNVDYDIEGNEITITPDRLAYIINKTYFAASVEKYRGSLQGVLWDVSKSKTHIVATDARRMSHLVLDDVKASKNIRASIPAVVLRDAARVFAKGVEDVKITLNESKMKLEQECQYGNAEAIISGYEDTYPKYESVVDAERDSIEFILDTSALQEIIDRVTAISPNDADFFIEENSIKITSDASIGDYEEELPITDFKGESAVVRMSLNYVREMISVSDSQPVKVRIGSLSRPIEFVVNAGFSFMIQPIERKEVDTLPE
jgi:DNA polymerase III sliding clamp (beta) subunit (PCNA family)